MIHHSLNSILCSRALAVITALSLAKYDVLSSCFSSFISLNEECHCITIFRSLEISSILSKYQLWLGHMETFPDLSRSRGIVLDMCVIVVLKDYQLSRTVCLEECLCSLKRYIFSLILTRLRVSAAETYSKSPLRCFLTPGMDLAR